MLIYFLSFFQVSQKFFEKFGFPSVIGALDCTLIRIKSPGGKRAETYRSRRGKFSLNVQTVSDADLLIRNLVVRWPGSTHDSTIFDHSYLRAHLETEVPNRYHVLGDLGYPLRSYLMTPFSAPATDSEKRIFPTVWCNTSGFNSLHSKAPIHLFHVILFFFFMLHGIQTIYADKVMCQKYPLLAVKINIALVRMFKYIALFYVLNFILFYFFRYNEAQILARNVVERQYGVWKKRCACIAESMRCQLQNSQTIIVATAVLHNIAIILGDSYDEGNFTPGVQDGPVNHNTHHAGMAKRNAIVANYFVNI
ncbi:uncharacterized protein LOC129230211 [Uloborus diversus]|uniref:uncharacterized protein LOC129230211 n=1 Tax=Uloborus diversus TaxID=327109 RepID=UPI0024094ED8|nr:uncharacterized protein LOC129230211 [Uloborus diversus]